MRIAAIQTKVGQIILFFLLGCGGARDVSFLEQDTNQEAELSIRSEVGGGLSAVFPASSTATFRAKSQPTSPLKGAYLEVSPGGLAQATKLSLLPAQSVYSQYFLDAFKFSVADLKQDELAIYLKIEDQKVLQEGVTLALPALKISSDQKKAILYHREDGAKSVLGIWTEQHTGIVEEKNLWRFKTRYQGSYQAIAIPENSISRLLVNEQLVEFNPFSQAHLKELGGIDWGLSHDSAQSTQRVAHFFSHPDFTPTLCHVYVYSDKNSDFFKKEEIVDLSDFVVFPDSADMKTIFVKYECIDNKKRFLFSPWHDTYTIKEISFDFSQLQSRYEETSYSISVQGYGINEYRYFINQGAIDCVEELLGEWILADKPIDVSFPEYKGGMTLCIQGKDSKDFISKKIEKTTWEHGPK